MKKSVPEFLEDWFFVFRIIIIWILLQICGTWMTMFCHLFSIFHFFPFRFRLFCFVFRRPAKNLSGVLPSRQWFIGSDAVPGRHYTPQRLKHGTWRGCGMCHENEKRIKTIHTFAIRQHIIQHESHQFFVSFRLENKIFNSGHWWTAWKGFLQLCHGHLQQQELSFDTHQFHARSCSHACQRASWAFH